MTLLIAGREGEGQDHVWLDRARNFARHSPCSVQIGAILISRYSEVFTGHNAPPLSHPQGRLDKADRGKGCDEWCARRKVIPELKCPGYTDCETVHAEAWALQAAGPKAVEGRMYVTSPPCNLCARAIAGAGVERLVFTATNQLARERKLDLSVAYLVKCGVAVTVVME